MVQWQFLSCIINYVNIFPASFRCQDKDKYLNNRNEIHLHFQVHSSTFHGCLVLCFLFCWGNTPIRQFWSTCNYSFLFLFSDMERILPLAFFFRFSNIENEQQKPLKDLEPWICTTHLLRPQFSLLYTMDTNVERSELFPKRRAKSNSEVNQPAFCYWLF